MISVLAHTLAGGWDAALAGFRARYHLDLRECLTSMPLGDLVAHIRGLSQWGDHEENTARLLDRVDYDVHTQWAQLTADPDDPKHKAARARRAALGIPTPPTPLIPPVALRPPEQAQRAWDEYIAVAERYSLPPEPEPASDTPAAVLDVWMLQNFG